MTKTPDQPPVIEAVMRDAPLLPNSVDLTNSQRFNTHDAVDPEQASPFSQPLLTCLQTTIKDLTLDEKIKLLSGKSLWQLTEIPRLFLPSLTVSDGPHGLRKPLQEMSLHESYPATCFPTAAALACSWDRSVLYSVGSALCQECLHYDIDVILGPGMNLKRHPAGGRNFEYLSEDPYLTGELALAYVQGVQATNQIGACPKHFAVNNQESHRFVVNALVDERTARELYYSAFETVIKQGKPETLMCAYNKVNGQFCSEHMVLLRQLLRNEWKYEGVVMTDWGACNNRPKGIAATLDLEMPGSHGAHRRMIRKALKKANKNLLESERSNNTNNGVNDQNILARQSGDSENSATNGSLIDNNGSNIRSVSGRIDDSEIIPLTMDEVDECAERVLNLIQKHAPLHADDRSIPVPWEEHHQLAKKVAMQCAVLLQNRDKVLPLPKDTSVAIIGDFARYHPRYQGMGSSQVYSERVVTAYEEVSRHTENVMFAQGYHADDDDPQAVYPDLIDEAVETSKQAEVVLLAIGLPEIMESEGFDRVHTGLPAQHNALVDAICKVHSKVVVLLSNGGALTLPWADKPQAILEGYLLGETGGAAMVDLVFGVTSPSGKLAETFAFQSSDILADRYFPGTRDVVEYREGLNVGYRYFDSVQKAVRFPFGHGLSYTEFEYSNINVVVDVDKDDEKLVLVTFDLTNVGETTGKEVAQCYIHVDKSGVYHPEQELRAFDKIELQPGESRTVTLKLNTRAFAYYDIGYQSWIVQDGSYEVRIGSSSRDIRLRSNVTFKTGRQPSPEAVFTYPPVQSVKEIDEVDDAKFARRFGAEEGLDLSELNATIGGHELFHRNTLLKDLAKSSWLGKLMLYYVFRTASKDFPEGPKQRRQKRMVRATVENLPLRALVLFSKGVLTFELLDACIASANWQIWTMIKMFTAAIVVIIRRKK